MTKVKIEDYYGDACFSDDKKLIRSPHGKIIIYEDDKEIRSSNLWVYQGREWLAEKIMNVDNTAVTWFNSINYFVSWLGVGNGAGGTSYNPTSPTKFDLDLNNILPISNSDSNCAGLSGGWYYYLPFTNLTFIQDEWNSNKYLQLRVQATLEMGHANGPGTQAINEAGLFLSTSNSGGHTGPFYLFARVTFPTFLKDSTKQLLFEWYLFL